LEALSEFSQIHPYRRTAENSFFQCLENSHWSLRPYIDGIQLDRETWLNDAWRIDALADFLIRLREQTSGQGGPRFSIASYAEERMAAWHRSRPQIAAQLKDSFQTLEINFFPVHDALPPAFCHGDYHPLNMVWGKNSIRSVIDWEFFGIKPELYDAALLVGCIGFEDPDNLIHEPVIRLVRILREAGFGTEVSWNCFLELAAAIRFGWMSEWIRRDDREAQEMELVYIDILLGQKDYISNHWKT
jgi:homoserine kinase type II